jgi:hypothetical protein
MRTCALTRALACTALGAMLLTACAPQAAVGPREQQSVISKPDEQLTPEQRKYRDAREPERAAVVGILTTAIIMLVVVAVRRMTRTELAQGV